MQSRWDMDRSKEVGNGQGLTAISRDDHRPFTAGVDKGRGTLNRTTMNVTESTVTEAPAIPAWIRPLLRHAVALLLALSGPVLVVGALMMGMVAGSPGLIGCGLLGGALLTACGGIGLLWSLGSRKQG